MPCVYKLFYICFILSMIFVSALRETQNFEYLFFETKDTLLIY